MKSKRKAQAVTIKSVKHANAKLMTRGVVVKGRNASTGSITVRIERGSLNHQRVITSDEMREAFKVALEGNA
jgi:hypothetical protein